MHLASLGAPSDAKTAASGVEMRRALDFCFLSLFRSFFASLSFSLASRLRFFFSTARIASRMSESISSAGSAAALGPAALEA